MGEETQEKLFNDEELVILGEKEPEPQKEPETPSTTEPEKPAEVVEKTEQKEEATEEEKAAAEKMGLRIDKGYIVDDDGTKIPAKRWKSLYRDYQDTRRESEEKDRKFKFFKELGPEKYYELYPDEKPADYKPPEKPRPAEAMPNLGNMIVQGGAHDGKTLNDVWAEDPAAAAYLQTQYLNAERDKVETERQTQERLKKESEEEIGSFSEQLSKDMFGKEAAKLSQKEESKVTETIQAVLNWMEKTRRGGGRITDAYFLMNKDNILLDAKAKGGKEALESLRKPSVPSVSTGGGSVAAPFAGYEDMSPDQILAAVEKMGETGYMTFLKEAPASLRAKHPGLPWS